MEIKNLTNGKKLNKKELRSIKGGLLQCIDPATGFCTTIGPKCFERRCQIIIHPPLD